MLKPSRPHPPDPFPRTGEGGGRSPSPSLGAGFRTRVLWMKELNFLGKEL